MSTIEQTSTETQSNQALDQRVNALTEQCLKMEKSIQEREEALPSSWQTNLRYFLPSLNGVMSLLVSNREQLRAVAMDLLTHVDPHKQQALEAMGFNTRSSLINGYAYEAWVADIKKLNEMLTLRDMKENVRLMKKNIEPLKSEQMRRLEKINELELQMSAWAL